MARVGIKMLLKYNKPIYRFTSGQYHSSVWYKNEYIQVVRKSNTAWVFVRLISRQNLYLCHKSAWLYAIDNIYYSSFVMQPSIKEHLDLCYKIFQEGNIAQFTDMFPLDHHIAAS